MNAIKKLYTIGILLVVSLQLTGCSIVQVRDRTYLQAVEITQPKDTGEYRITLHDFTQPEETTAAVGTNLDEALEKAAVPLGKSLFLGHLELIAYSDGKYTSELSEWMETYRLSPACKVLLQTEAPQNQCDTLQLAQQLRLAEEKGLVPETSLLTILRERSSAGQTALLPAWTTEGFSTAIVHENGEKTALTPSATAGLCWLRGENHPDCIALSETESYTVTYSAIRLLAQEENNTVHVTAQVHLRGSGDFDQAAGIVRQQCMTAYEETTEQEKGDVIGLAACLQSQCYDFVQNRTWAEQLSDLTFSVEVIEKF